MDVDALPVLRVTCTCLHSIEVTASRIEHTLASHNDPKSSRKRVICFKNALLVDFDTKIVQERFYQTSLSDANAAHHMLGHVQIETGEDFSIE